MHPDRCNFFVELVLLASLMRVATYCPNWKQHIEFLVVSKHSLPYDLFTTSVNAPQLLYFACSVMLLRLHRYLGLRCCWSLRCGLGSLNSLDALSIGHKYTCIRCMLGCSLADGLCFLLCEGGSKQVKYAASSCRQILMTASIFACNDVMTFVRGPYEPSLICTHD